jgi:predicted permease
MPLLPHELRYAVRSLRRRPGFTAAVVATLAVAIAASTTMFSLLDAALLRPLPFAQPGRLAIFWGVAGPERAIRGASVPEILDWRAGNRSFSDVAIFDPISLNVRVGDAVERAPAEMVSASYFPLLRIAAARGRAFLPEEDGAAEAHPVAIVSHRLWQTRLGGDPGVVGRTITVNDRQLTVVGVAPEGFGGLSITAELWIPTSMISLTGSPSLITNRGTRWLAAVGRLRDGVALPDAQRDLDAVALRLQDAYPATNKDRGVRLMSLEENYLGTTRPLLRALFGAVILFLLIACANVAGLQLVRAASRGREVALRLALGATRTHLVRQLAAEGAVLAAAGGAVGVLASLWASSALVSLAPEGLLPAYVRPAVDARVLLFALALVGACALVCGLVPALAGARLNLAGALKDGARAAAPGLGRIARPGAQQLFVVGEVALALALLAGAGLMAQSLAAQLAVPPGFDPEGVLVARASLPRERYDAPARVRFAEQLEARLRAIPSVRAASVSSDMPFTGNSSASRLVTDRGEAESIRFYRHAVTPGFFETLGIRLVGGRAFDARDRDGAQDVAIISEAMARRVWPGESAVGHRIRMGRSEVTVVGVVGTARFRSLTTDLSAPASEPDVYFSFAQLPDRDVEIAVRSRTGALPSAGALREALAAVDPSLPLFAVQPLADVLRQQSADARFGSAVLSSLAAIALFLAGIGIYGIIAFVVGLSRREIAIRMALGAEAREVVALVVRNGMTLAAAGVVLGLLAAAAGARALATQLVGVTTTDVPTFAATSLAVAAIALLATVVPARSAARVDPQLALKAE